MSKELEYVKGILEYQPLTLNNRMIIETILKKLQRLEAIDNSNPSKALNELEKVIEEITISNADLRNTLKTSVLIATIKQALLKAQEQEKVLKIIKEKEVNMQVFNQCEDVETYNKVYIKQEERQLTQEEFDTLKRWLNEITRAKD